MADPSTSYCNVQKPAVIAVLCISSIAYGAHFIVALTTLYWNQRERRRMSSKSWARNLFCIFVLFFLGSVNTLFTITVCVADGEKRREEFVILFVIAAVAVTLIGGALLLIRCYIVWNYNKVVVTLPVLLFFAACGTGIYHTKPYVSLPTLSAEAVLSFVLFWCLALALNVTLTTLMVAKILYARSALNTIIQSRKKDREEVEGIRSTYTCIIGILTESSALYTVVIIFGVILTLLVSDVQFVFSPLVVQTDCIASELIILRTVLGKAWTSSTWQRCTGVDRKTSEALGGQARDEESM